MTPIRDNLRRSVGWWAWQAISAVSVGAFFFALMHVLTVLSPDRMPS